MLASWAGPGSVMEKGGGCGRARLLGGGMSSWAVVARVRYSVWTAARCTTRTDQSLSPTSKRLSHKGWSVDPTTQSGRRRGLDRQDT